MKKFFAALLPTFLFLTLCGCGQSATPRASVDLFSGSPSVLTLARGDSAAFDVTLTASLCGVEAETASGAGQLRLTVYAYDRDYAKTVTDGRVLFQTKLDCTLEGATQTALFAPIDAGRVLIVFEAESDSAALTLYDALSPQAAGCTFLHGGAQTEGAAAVRLLFEPNASGVYLTATEPTASDAPDGTAPVEPTTPGETEPTAPDAPDPDAADVDETDPDAGEPDGAAENDETEETPDADA